jgi:membrane-associated phospholipid phosphatase
LVLQLTVPGTRADAAAGDAECGPGTADRVVTAGLVTTGLATALLLEPVLAPEKARWVEPPGFDVGVRDALRWHDDHLRTALTLSRVLTISVTLSSLGTPFLSRHPYGDFLSLVLQPWSATLMTTTALKISVGRQRPYARYGTFESRGSSDNVGFPSGDTSSSFAIATSTAYLLGREHTDYAPLVWSVSLLLASSAGYLRIAADYHYFSDVMTGAALGSLLGILFPMLQADHYFCPPDANPDADETAAALTSAPLIGPSLGGVF